MKLKMKPIILLDIITLIFLIQFKVFECFSIENDSNIDQNDQNIIDNNQQQQQTQSNRLTTTISVPVNNDDHHQISSALPFKIINSKHSLHSHNHDGSKHEGELPPRRFQIAKFDFEHVSTPYIILLWIIIVGLAKMGFHVTPKLSSICPESVVLMILGVVIGLIMYFAGIPEERLQPLTPNLFFLYMLPPIVMDAGYHMPNRLFFDNLISILLYAVVGTIWNAIAIGFSLYGCSKWGVFGDEEIPFLDIMLFSSTVSAVDPVAVLAVFEEIHVNEVLYILVFGESLLNDGVTVVLYHMFEGYAEMAYHYGIDSIQTIDLISGVASFFVVAIGGTTMGICWGFLAAFVSRFTHHVKIIEPVFVFVMAYLSYLSAEMFHLSGILSLTFCGITMKNYVEENITQKSHTTLKYAMKMLANSSEAIIFVFLGVCTVNDQHNWNTAFVVLTIIFCLVYRTIGVIILTALTNRYRLHKVNPVEQFIMSYGGLRGAVAFALILIINRQIIHAREMMVTTIIAVVYFTVFLQGMTVGTLVKILNVPRANKFELTMNERIHTRLMDHLMAGIEDISGMMMGNYKLRDKFRYYNNRYLRKWLLRDSKEMGNSSRKIFETCSRLDLRDAMTLVSRQQHLMATNNGVIGKSAINTHAAYTNANFVVDEDDYKNNNINGHDSNGGKPTIPRIFLTVPGNPALATNNGQQTMTPILIDPNQSLTTLFRTFTESNLNALYNIDGDNNPTVLAKIPELDPKLEDYALSDDSINTKFNEPKKVDFNYDIGTVVYSPSLKDLKDAELHHILNDAMFKPFKKAHHYSRSDYYEEPKVHPPFQHQVRMQIRKMISERENQRRRRHTHHASYHPCPSNNTKVDNKNNNNSNNMQHQTPSSNGQDGGKNLLSVDRNAMISKQNPRQLLKRSKSANEIDNLDNFTKEAHTNNGENNNENNDDDDNDDGITFVAKKKYSLAQDKNIDNNNKSEESKKELIKNFPWNHHDIKSSEQNEDSMTSVDSSSATSHSSNVHQSSQPNNNTKKKKRKTSDVVRQREFPSWIDNRDYVNDYCSPTVTLLERINFFDNIDGNGGQTNVDGNNIRSSSTSTTISPVPSLKTNDNQLLSSNKNKSDKVPSFFEIFNLNKNDIKSIDDETSTESNKPNTNNSKNQSIDQSKISKGSNDTIIEFKKSLSKDDNHYDDDNNDDSLIMISKL